MLYESLNINKEPEEHDLSIDEKKSGRRKDMERF